MYRLEIVEGRSVRIIPQLVAIRLHEAIKRKESITPLFLFSFSCLSLGFLFIYIYLFEYIEYIIHLLFLSLKKEKFRHGANAFTK